MYGHAVGHVGVAYLVVAEILEIESVHDLVFVLRRAALESDVAVGVLHLGHRGMGRAVGVDDAVAEEIGVARRVHSVIAAIGPVLHAVLILLGEALVDPVPDESALQVGIFVDALPLQPQRSRRVAHRVSVLRRHDGAVGAAASDALEPARARVLRHVHVAVPLPLRAFVTDGAVHAALAVLLVGYELVSQIEVVAVARLVAERPDGDAGVVLVDLVHVVYAVEMRRFPRGVVCERAALVEAVTHSVRLDVGFAIDIQAYFVAQFVKTSGLRVVAGAHGVDVVAAHDLQVAAQILLREVVARELVVLVDIHSLELDRLAVYQKYFVRASRLALFGDLRDLETAESHVERYVFGRAAAARVHRKAI